MTVPLSRRGVRTYPGMSSRATCQGTLSHSRLGFQIFPKSLQRRKKAATSEKMFLTEDVTDPEQRLPLNNPEDFPAPVSDVEERRRQSSLSDTASLSSPPNPSPLGT